MINNVIKVVLVLTMAYRKLEKRGTHAVDIQDMMVPKKRQSTPIQSDSAVTSHQLNKESSQSTGKII